MTTSFNWILQSVNIIWYCPGKGYHLLPLIPSIWMGIRWRMWLFMESFKTLEFWSTTNSPGPITLQGSAVQQERFWACSIDSFIKTPLQTPLSSCTWVLSVHIWNALPNLGIHILSVTLIRFTLHVNGFSYDELLNIVSTPRLQERRLHLKLAQVYKVVHGLCYFPEDISIILRQTSRTRYCSLPFCLYQYHITTDLSRVASEPGTPLKRDR